MRRIADLAFAQPRRILAAAFVVTLLALVLGTPVAGELSTDGDDFISTSAESTVGRNVLERASGDETIPGLLVLRRGDGEVRTSLGVRRAVNGLAGTLRASPAVDHVATYFNTRDRSLVSRDGRSTYLAATLKTDNDEDEVARLVADLRTEPGVTVGGAAVAGPEIGKRTESDLARAELIAFPLLLLLSLWIFRGLVAALIPPLIGLVTILITFVGLRVVNETVGLSTFALNLVTGLGLGLAIDYSLFVVSRYREELGRVGPGREALRRTMATAGRTVLFSSVTVAAALACLLVFPLKFLSSMGVGGLLCALVASGVSLTMLPALLALLGPRINAGAPAAWRRRNEAAAAPVTRGFWYRLSRAVMAAPATVAVATATVLIIVGLPFARATFTTVDDRSLPLGSEARTVSTTIGADFRSSSVSPIGVVVRAPKDGRTIRALRDRVARVPGVVRTTPITALDAGVRTFQAVVRGPADRSPQQDAVRDIRALPGGGERFVIGAAAGYRDQKAAIASGLPAAIALVCVTTVLILFLMTGSVVLPLKALVMNFLTVSVAFGILVVIFEDGRLEGLLDYQSIGGLELTQPVLLFALAFGLSTDYGVFLLSRIKEARDAGAPNAEAVALGIQRTGRIVTAAALLFCVAIGAFATSDILFVKQIGVGVAAAVAVDATVIRGLLVPSLMALLDERNWWAPGPLRRLHARIGISEGVLDDLPPPPAPAAAVPLIVPRPATGRRGSGPQPEPVVAAAAEPEPELVVAAPDPQPEEEPGVVAAAEPKPAPEAAAAVAEPMDDPDPEPAAGPADDPDPDPEPAAALEALGGNGLAPIALTQAEVAVVGEDVEHARRRVASIVAFAEQAAEDLRVRSEHRAAERIAEADRAAALRLAAAEAEAAALLAQARAEAHDTVRDAREAAADVREGRVPSEPNGSNGGHGDGGEPPGLGAGPAPVPAPDEHHTP